MSSIRLWYLYCDGEDCPRRDGGQQPFIIDPHPQETPAMQRAKAAGAGWTTKGRLDFCRLCSSATGPVNVER
jgi:hypothetical protein